MSKAPHVRFNVPKEVASKILQSLEVTADSGKLRRGTNEVTKAVERGIARLVVIAEDVTPPEVVAHLPMLCEEKNTPYGYVPDKKQLGTASGIDVSAAAIAVIEPGDAEELIKDVIGKLKSLK